MGTLKDIKYYLKGVALSYAHIYFSNSFWLGLVLMAVTFFDLVAGLSGLIAIAICQVCTAIFSFNKTFLFTGAYSYNALMVGLALGSFYTASPSYFTVLVIASMLSFFLTVFISGRLEQRGLPFLSLPFLITIWVLLSGLQNFSGIRLVTKSAFSLQQWFPAAFSRASEWIDALGFSDFIHIYLRSLSANFFQYNDLAGIIVAIALLIRSRMAFALTVYGFLIGYLFYYFFQGDFTPLIYSYIGFNFILTAVALGGFFIVPSLKSHLLLLFVIPVTALLLSALHTVFSLFQLPLYSLPFNITVLLTIGALQMRLQARGLQLVVLQQYSPELNHYKTVYHARRFDGQYYHHLFLPVMGEWHISQGYAGTITHKEGWQHALDFDIKDEEGRTFRGPGFSVSDYYCYDLPVLAPASGYVTTVRDGVPDNAIYDVNLQENWGNTIIIKHDEGLYTKLSHLRPNSIKVKEGSYVYRGEIIAACGSSGRSPEPHLHFQVQANPYIGSQTLPYPIAYFLTRRGDAHTFHAFEVPKEGDTVRNLIAHPVLAGAFGMIPGRELVWQVEQPEGVREDRWSVYVDIYNKQYLFCHRTGATAYFFNDGTLFYFTDFYGSRRSFLHRFYIAFQKVLLGHYKGAALHDWLLPHTFFDPVTMALQDFVAPFFHFLRGTYEFRFAPAGSTEQQDAVVLQTRSSGRLFGKSVQETTATMVIGSQGIDRVELYRNNHKTIARCVQ